MDRGSVTVTGNLTVAPGGELLAAFGGSDLSVGGNLAVETDGVLVLGCEPLACICFNDPERFRSVAEHGRGEGDRPVQQPDQLT